MLRAALLVALTLAALPSVSVGQPAPGKYALLVGCTKYPDAADECGELYGSKNDVPNLANMLTKRFGFPEANITRLLGWPDDEARRPTYRNITARLKQLVAMAEPGSQVVLYFSGHGSQMPIPDNQDPLDPKNPEPDGLDEIFLPADFKANKDGSLENYLKDDEIAGFLDQFRAKGAAVWIIFDCCHSGSMMRGGDVERSRSVPLAKLPIPAAVIQKAIDRAKDAVAKAKTAPAQPGALDVTAKDGPGSVVAFYAAQSFETAPELPRPWDAKAEPENYYGLLSYTLMNILEQAQSPLSYRELTQILVDRYRGERGSRGPTPFAEGDLDREVLGQKQWPNRADLVMQRKGGKLVLSGGELMGLSRDSILAVHPPAGDKRPVTDVLGHVQVQSLTPLTAEVAPCPFPPKQAAKVEDKDLPQLSRCELVTRSFNDMRLKLALPAAGDPKQAERIKTLQTAVQQLDPQVAAMIDLVGEPAQAQWQLQVENDKVFLVPTLEQRNTTADAGTPIPSFRIGGYPGNDGKLLAGFLERDLPRIFKVENLWRVAGNMAKSKEESKLILEVRKVEPGPVGPVQNGERLYPGQNLDIRINNTGFDTLWVTMLLLDGHYAVDVKQFPLQAGRPAPPFSFTLDGESSGLTGVIVFGTPLAPNQPKPDLSFLAQFPLKVVEKDRAKPEMAPNTPFGRLLSMAAFHSGSRSLLLGEPTNPYVVSRCWMMMPDPKAPAAPRK